MNKKNKQKNLTLDLLSKHSTMGKALHYSFSTWVFKTIFYWLVVGIIFLLTLTQFPFSVYVILAIIAPIIAGTDVIGVFVGAIIYYGIRGRKK